MSYAQAEKVAKLATFYNAVTAQEVKTYLQEAAFLEAVANAEHNAGRLAGDRHVRGRRS